jgi:hypothetical protein
MNPLSSTNPGLKFRRELNVFVLVIILEFSLLLRRLGIAGICFASLFFHVAWNATELSREYQKKITGLCGRTLLSHSWKTKVRAISYPQ